MGTDDLRSDLPSMKERKAKFSMGESGDSFKPLYIGKKHSNVEINIRPVDKNTYYFPYILLNFVAIIWGTQHAVIKHMLEVSNNENTGYCTFIRFLVAAICFAPWTPNPFSSTAKESEIKEDDNTNNSVYESSLSSAGASSDSLEAKASQNLHSNENILANVIEDYGALNENDLNGNESSFIDIELS